MTDPQRQMRLGDLYEWVELPRIPDRRGSLTVIEGGSHVPFDIARVYYLYDMPNSAVRAGHAHRRLNQLIIAAAGAFNVNLDDGFEQQTMRLNRPDRGLLLRPMVWRTIDGFATGSLCLVLASIPYDEAEYVRDYEEYVRLRRSAT